MPSNSVLFYIGGRVLNAALSLATLMMINRMIQPEDYGRFAYLSMLAGFIGLISYGWVWSHGFRFGARDSVVQGMQRSLYWLLLSAPVALLLTLAIVLIQDFSIYETVFLLVFSLGVAVFNVGQKIQASHSKLKENISFALFRSIVNFSLLVGLLLVIGAGGKEALFTAGVVGFLAAGVTVLFYEGALFTRWHPVWPQNNELRFGVGIAGSAFLTQLNYGVDKVVVSNILGDRSTGLYTHSYELVFFIIMFVLSVYNISTYPKLQKQYDAKTLSLNEILTRSFRWFSLITVILVSVMYLSKPLFLLLISDNYRDVFDDMFAYNLTISILTCFIAFHINYAFQLTQQPRFQIYAGAVSLAVNIALSLILVQHFELEGVAIATIVAQLLMILLSLIMVRRFKNG